MAVVVAVVVAVVIAVLVVGCYFRLLLVIIVIVVIVNIAHASHRSRIISKWPCSVAIKMGVTFPSYTPYKALAAACGYCSL